MNVLGEPGKQYEKVHKLNKNALRKFLSRRYGSIAAEKWQNIFNFEPGPLDFETFTFKLCEQMFLKPKTMTQVAFDFYDSNNDAKITEFDLFRTFYFYGSQKRFDELMEESI